MVKHSAEYEKYMRSEAWEKKRFERLELDDNKCVMCGRPNGLQKDGTTPIAAAFFQRSGGDLAQIHRVRRVCRDDKALGQLLRHRDNAARLFGRGQIRARIARERGRIQIKNP